MIVGLGGAGLDLLADALAHHRAREGRDPGQEAVGGIGLVLADDAEGRRGGRLRAGCSRPSRTVTSAEPVRRGLHLGAVAAGGPVAQFAGGASGGFSLSSAASACGMGVAVAGDLGLDQREAAPVTRLGKGEISRSGSSGDAVVVAFPGEGLAHGLNLGRAAASGQFLTQSLPGPARSRRPDLVQS